MLLELFCRKLWSVLTEHLEAFRFLAKLGRLREELFFKIPIGRHIPTNLFGLKGSEEKHLLWTQDLSAIDEPMWKTKFTELLNNHFEELKQKNRRFSVRAYARKLGLANGTLSDVMNSKLSLTPDRAIKVLAKLDIDQRKKDKLLVLLNKQHRIAKDKLPRTHFDVFSNWTYRAILFSFDLDGSRWTSQELADRLLLKPKQIEQMIEVLLKLDLLKKEKDGSIVREQKYWEMNDDDRNEFIHRSHQDSLSLASKAISLIPAHKRDITSMMFAGDSQQLEELRNEIRHLYERALSIMETPSKNEVYQLSIQLHPLDLRNDSEAK